MRSAIRLSPLVVSLLLSIASVAPVLGCGSAAPPDEATAQASTDLIVQCAWPTYRDCEEDTYPNGKPFMTCQCDDLPTPQIASLAAGSNTTYALGTDGWVYSWGSNMNCALGSSATLAQSPNPHPVLAGVSQVAAGDTGACALTSDGAVHCWGTIVSSPVTQLCAPTVVPGLPAAKQIAHGKSHACAIDTNGFVWCWGDDQYGQLGDAQAIGVAGAGTATAMAVSSVKVNHIVQIVAGGNTTCARRADDAVFCWGDDSQGGLGDAAGAGKSVNGPLQVVGWTISGNTGGAVSLFGGGNGTFCGEDLWSTKTLCWGANQYGQAALTFENPPFGDVCGNGLGCSPSPSALNTTEGPFIALGKNHSCVGGTTVAGGASSLGCVGLNSNGQLGNGSLSSASALTSVPNYAPFVQFAVGDSHTCATFESYSGDNNVMCWGLGTSGQLGASTLTSSEVAQPIVWFP